MANNQQSKTRMLLIDDNPAIHDDFRKILNTEDDEIGLSEAALAFLGDEVEVKEKFAIDVDIESAYQGEEGYEMVLKSLEEKRPYTLAFCDMRMPPGWDGLKTVEKLFEADPELQIVICSAYSDNTWSDIVERLGESDRLLILKKPFDNAEVMQMTVSLIEKRRLMIESQAREENLASIVEESTQQLAEARSDTEQLLSAVEAAILSTDTNGVIQRWNEQAAEIFEVGSQDAIGQRIDQLPIQWETGSKLEGLWTLEECGSSTEQELQFVDSDSELRTISFSSFPVFAGCEVNGFLIQGTDVTESRKMEQELRRAQQVSLIGKMATGVAQEIKVPMRGVNDNLEYLNSRVEDLLGFIQGASELLELAGQHGIESEKVAALKQVTDRIQLDEIAQALPKAVKDSLNSVGHMTRIVQALDGFSVPESADY